MSRERVLEALRLAVYQRAQELCEYCRVHDRWSFLPINRIM